MDKMLLTTKGILDLNAEPLETPFDKTLVHHGNYGEGYLAVIVDRHQIWTYDGNWAMLLESELELNCLLWTGHGLLVGTEQARLAWASDEGLEFITAVDELPDRKNWTTPWGGPPDVRSLAITTDGTIFANIHVGWIIASTDGGVSWEARTEGLDKDVHQVNTHPTEPNTVFAATARGFYLSQDSGLTFDRKWSRSPTYQRATAWYADRDVVLVSVSRGSSGSSARLYRSTTRGDDWQLVEDLPTASSNINTHQISLTGQGEAYVIVDNTSLYRSIDYGQNWELFLSDLPKTYQLVKYPNL